MKKWKNYLAPELKQSDLLELNDISRRESSYTVEADLFDRCLTERIKEDDDDPLTEMETELPDPINKIVEDLFVSAYKYKPTLKREGDIDVEYQANRALVDKVLKMPDWKEIHRQSKGDEIISSAVATEFMKSLLQTHGNEIKKISDTAKAFKQAKKDSEAMREEINDLKRARHSKDIPEAEKQRLRKQLNRMRKQFQKQNKVARQKLREYKKAIPDLVNYDAMKQGLDAAAKEAQDTQDMEQALGILPGVGDGPSKNTIDKARIQMARALRKSQKLKQIFRELGKFQYLATKKFKSKIRHSAGEVTKVILDNEIANVLPSELVGLVLPELEPLFLKKYAEKELFAFETKQKERLGRGPIVVLIDESGSMRNTREVWAKAVALALITMARHQRRDIHIVPFSSGQLQKEFVFEHKKLGTQQHMQRMFDFADYFKGGGTSFETPLDRAMTIIKEKTHFKRADIVIITDGETYLQDEWLETFKTTKKRLEVSLYAIMINSYQMGEDNVLTPISDNIRYVSELTDEVAGTLFEKF